MTDFEQAVGVVLQHEDPGLTGTLDNDSGGLTRWGISQRSYPTLDIAHLSLDDAKEIYRKDYWSPIAGQDIVDQSVATKLLDMAVNMGVPTAIRIVQKVVGVKVDGVMGPVTLGAVNHADPQVVLAGLRQISVQRYREIVASDPDKYGQYLNGWLRRAEA